MMKTKNAVLINNLIEDLNNEFEYVSVLETDVSGKAYIICNGKVHINESFSTEHGFVVRVYNGINYAEHSFNNLDEDHYLEILNSVSRVGSKLYEIYKSHNIPFEKLPLIDDVSMNYHFEEEDTDTICDKSLVQIMLETLEKQCKSYNEIVDIRLKYERENVKKIFYSNKRRLSQKYFWNMGYVAPIVCEKGEIKYDCSYFSGNKQKNVISRIVNMTESTVLNAYELFNSKTIEPGQYDIICDPSVAGLIAHEALGHSMEMDLFINSRSGAEKYINKKIASEIVNVKDGRTEIKDVGSYFFDDEGNQNVETSLIKKGIVKNGLSDQLTSLRIKTILSGNGRRESYQRKAYARMSNTYFEIGNDNLKDMISSVKNGYLLEGAQSGMEDPMNLGMQCIIMKARKITDGKLTGEIFSPIVLSGNVIDLLMSITMVSNQKKLFGCGYCDKGYKESIKTSFGGAYIKCKGVLC